MKIEQFDYTTNLLQALLWQYNNAVNLTGLITQKQTWYDLNQTEFWTNFYNDIFNLETCNTFGLSLWSRILDVPAHINPTPEPPDTPIFGFNAYTTFPTLENTYVNFTQGNFSNQGQAFVLPPHEQRILLRLRYYQLTSSGAIPEINAFLNYLYNTTVFPDGQQFRTAYVVDNFNMTMTYVFNYAVSDIFLSILENLEGEINILPKPDGVKLLFLILTDPVFGFSTDRTEANSNQNFTNGDFIRGNFF
jgi:hypothetical protein